jgi:hypothetical protein
MPDRQSSSHVFAIACSAIAILVSAVTLYLTFLSPARLSIMAGDLVYLSHFKDKGNFSLIVPVSLTNSGSKFITVERFALLIQKPNSKEGYLLEPFTFQKLDDKGDFISESMSAPVSVVGRSAVTKGILFRSSCEKSQEFQITEAGTYEVTLLAWVGDSIQPNVTDSFTLILSEEDIKTLNEYLQQRKGTTIRLPQSKWRKWGAHHLTELEVNVLRQKN